MTHIVEPARLEAALAGYVPAFRAAYGARMRAKLGLALEDAADDALAADLLAVMADAQADFTRTFRMLADARREDLLLALGGSDAAAAWIARYDARLAREPRPATQRAAAMNAINPRIVLRNHLAQEAIEASEAGDDEPVRRLGRALRTPYSDDPAVAAFDRLASPDRPPVEVSCSS